MRMQVEHNRARAEEQPRLHDGQQEIVSRDPATGEEVGRALLCSIDDVQAAVKRARAAQNLGARFHTERAPQSFRALVKLCSMRWKRSQFSSRAKRASLRRKR